MKLIDFAKKSGITTYTDDELYELVELDKKFGERRLGEVDIVISYLFWKKIKKSLIDLPKNRMH